MVGLLACSLAAGCDGVIGAVPGDVSAAGSVRSNPEVSTTPLVSSRTTLDFGIVPQGSQQRLFFELSNASDEPIELDRIETSCECLEMTVSRMRLSAGEAVLACAKLDLAVAPRFTGGLGIEVRGYAQDGLLVFAINIDADVRPSWTFENFRLELQTKIPDVSQPVPMPTPR
jgi:hypothetical protein